VTAQILDCTVSCFRIGDPNGAYPIFDATGSTIAPGRPNMSGRRMIYTSGHYSTALIEKLVRGIGRLPPNEHYHLFSSQMAGRAGGSYGQLAFGEINAKAVAAPLIPAGHLGAGVPEARLDIALVDLGKGGKAGAQRMSRKEQFPVVLRQIDANTGGQCRLLGTRAICLPAARRRRACCHEKYGGRGTRALPPNSIQATGA
jgi:hypothetical protein